MVKSKIYSISTLWTIFELQRYINNSFWLRSLKMEWPHFSISFDPPFLPLSLQLCFENHQKLHYIAPPLPGPLGYRHLLLCSALILCTFLTQLMSSFRDINQDIVAIFLSHPLCKVFGSWVFLGILLSSFTSLRNSIISWSFCSNCLINLDSFSLRREVILLLGFQK